MGPFGKHYKEKNLFQAYFVEMVKAAEDCDVVYFQQLRDEVLEMENGFERYQYIWYHLSSSTRKKLKSGII